MGKLFPEVSGQVVTLFAFPACFAFVPSTLDCPLLAHDAPDAAVRIFDSVGAGSGITPLLQVGPVKYG